MKEYNLKKKKVLVVGSRTSDLALWQTHFVKNEIEAIYQFEVVGILPVSEDMLTGGVFVLRFPNHPITKELRNLITRF